MIETSFDEFKRRWDPAATPASAQRGTEPPPPRVAFLALSLLEKLDTGRRRPPPSLAKVFRLYCIECLSAAQVARRCRCSKAAVIRRLNLIRKKTGLSPGSLRNLGPEPSINDLIPDPRSKVRRNNILYADSTQDSFAE